MDNATSLADRDAADFGQMQALVQQAWTPQAHWHIGDLAWQRWHLDGEHAWKTRIWEVEGVPVGWGWIDNGESV